MQLVVSPEDLQPIVRACVEELLRAGLDSGADRLGYPEREAAQLLGIEHWRLRDARRRGELAGKKIGKSYVYSRAELLAYLAGKK